MKEQEVEVNPNAVLKNWTLTKDRALLGLLANPKKTARKEEEGFDWRNCFTAQEVAKLNHQATNETAYRLALEGLVKQGLAFKGVKKSARKGAISYAQNFEAIARTLYFFIFKEMLKKELPDNYKIPDTIVQAGIRFVKSHTIHLSAKEGLKLGRKTARSKHLFFKMLLVQLYWAALYDDNYLHKLDEGQQAYVERSREKRNNFTDRALSALKIKIPQESIDEERAVVESAYTFVHHINKQQPPTKELSKTIQEMFAYIKREKEKRDIVPRW